MPPDRSLRTAVVLRVAEQSCELWLDGAAATARYAPPIPAPRVERISPGHLVAVATGDDGAPVVVWRWYDAVVLGHDGPAVRMWEPAHGEFLALARPAYEPAPPGSRAYASAGLPGAEWWVACAAPSAQVELDAVAALYAEYGMWDDALAGGR